MTRKFSAQKRHFIRNARFKNLYIIPYSRGRLNFAALAARAIQEEHFETVLVDLPYFMNSGELLKESSKLFPLCHSLMIKKDKAYFTLFPFTPTDAACASVVVVQILKDMGIPNVRVRCIDDSNVINYPQEGFLQKDAYLKDDSFVLKVGPEKYFDHLFQELESEWEDYPEKTKFFCEHRAGLVAQRIAEEAKKGRKVLLICEWRLWWLVSKKLDKEQLGSENFFLPDWKDLNAAVILEDPLLFWVKGMMDDFPAVVARFCSNMKLFSLKSFNKLQVIDEFIKNSMDKSVLEKAGNVSVRKVIAFHNYLKNRLTFDLRVCPQPVSHLFDAATSCVGKKYARELARLLLEYPCPRRWQIKGFLIIRERSADQIAEEFEVTPSEIKAYLLTGTLRYSYDRFSEEDPEQYYEDRLKIANTVCPVTDPGEAETMGRGGFGLKWAIQEDYHLHEIACRKVRDIVSRLKRLHRIERSWGSMGEGIDWKATIASKASGENAIYIKRTMHYAKEKKSRFDEYTPVSFLFTDNFRGHLSSTIFDANKTLRNKNLGNKNFPYDKSPPEDLVYSIFYTFTRETDLYRGHFLKVRLSSITLLYTIHVMGDVRYERIMKKPSRFHCRMQPYSDTELYDFPLSELGVAWGVKYAEHTVLVAAKEGWKPSQKLSDFARKKRVQITPVTFSSFNPDFIDRLRELFFTSTALKKHADRDKIVKRYL